MYLEFLFYTTGFCSRVFGVAHTIGQPTCSPYSLVTQFLLALLLCVAGCSRLLQFEAIFCYVITVTVLSDDTSWLRPNSDPTVSSKQLELFLFL